MVFMHAGETNDKWAIYSNIVYGIGLVVSTVLGTLINPSLGYVMTKNAPTS